MIQVSNDEFITAIFGSDAPYCHVTDFSYDPNNIPQSEHLRAWKGDYYSKYGFGDLTNQYFTISIFNADEQGVARRRKALYKKTYCLVLDDVKEKLSIDEAKRLPPPSWIMETSPGSEQWGYILSRPCEDRAKIDNLNDGLIASDLAPSGKDPGQRGVTRYVRLPDGYNTKQSKMVDGKPFKCVMKVWSPFTTTTLEELAAPFHVDLNAERREGRVDGAAKVDDHPLLGIPEVLNIKEVRSDGRFDITCPWVDEHTGGVDNGTAIFTNDDGTLGFKCHHGSCEHRTGKHLLEYVEVSRPGFSTQLNTWQMQRAFSDCETNAESGKTEHVSQESAPDFSEPCEIEKQHTDNEQIYEQVLGQLDQQIPGSETQFNMAEKLLLELSKLPEIKKIHYHKRVCDIMRWSKSDFQSILKDLRSKWHADTSDSVDFFNETIFVAEQNQFFDRRKRIWYSPEAYQNTHAHLDIEARRTALQGRVTKVDRIDYAPKRGAVFEERGVVYGNAWHSEFDIPGTPGDVSVWLDHFDTLGWGENRDHVLKFMAWTILHPDIKINHMIVFGSDEGCGKDWLLYPLVKAMGDNHTTISGEELLENFNDYVLSTKHLHVNETELGDRNEALAVSAKLKPLCSAPPDTLRVNQKSVKKIEVRNLLNVTMTTNSLIPVRLKGQSRRIYALWSDLQVRDDWGNMKPEWAAYWRDAWAWMEKGGWQYCIHYLRNHVDLSDFNPGVAPPVTRFLRDIVEASRSPLQQAISRLIEVRMGVLQFDLVSTEDLTNLIHTCANMRPELVGSMTTRGLQPGRVGIALKELGKHFCTELQDEMMYMPVWCIRNHAKYRAMSPEQMLLEYKSINEKYKSAAKPALVVNNV